MPRIKAPSYKSRHEFIVACNELARLQVELTAAKAEESAALQVVRDKYGPLIDALGREAELLALGAEKYAEAHRDELLPGKAKSGETPLAIFGFRLGQPTLKPLNKSWTWARILEELAARGLTRFIRTKQEPDKEAMKQHLTAAELATVGCRIDQAESFFVEPKDEAIAAEKKGAA